MPRRQETVPFGWRLRRLKAQARLPSSPPSRSSTTGNGNRKSYVRRILPRRTPTSAPHTSYHWTRHVLESLHSENRKKPDATFYKVVLGEDRLVGGLFAVVCPDLGDGEWRCEGIYVDPDCQNRGIGKGILRQMYRKHPNAARWTLDTPEWATRNHAFYEGMGFVRFHITESPDLPFALYDYENTLTQDQQLALQREET